MKSVKHCLLFFFCTLILLPVGAFDWGGFFSNDTGFKGPVKDLQINQSNKLTLWMRVPLPEFKKSYFTAETFYSFGYKEKEFFHIWDLNLCKLSMAAKEGDSAITFNLGRFGISDISGLIFSQTADGMELIVDNRLLSAKIYAGFTGLLNNKTANMTSSNPEDKKLQAYQLASTAVIGSVFFTFPRLFAQQTLSCELYATSGTKPTGIFITAALNGQIKGPLFYITSTSWAFGKNAKQLVTVSNLSLFELTAFLPFYSSMLSWKSAFATGKTDGRIAAFEHFSLVSANIDSTVKYAGNIKSGITASIRPISALLCTASSDVFFNTMNSEKATGFAGAQWQASVRWQIINDLQLSCAAGQFFKSPLPAKGPYTFANIKILFSF